MKEVMPSTTVPISTDWLAVVRISALTIGFLACVGAIVTGHDSGDIFTLAEWLGTGLGILQVTSVAANAVNVRSFLNKPASGVVPQAVGTPLVTIPTSTQTVTNGVH